MPYGRRPKLGRLDLLCIGASPEKLAAHREVPAIDLPALSAEQQTELYRLNYRRQISTLSLAEEVMRQKLQRIARGVK